ncbi:hypothetical protein [Bartonella bovis]|nr:hypothetical protein [Bartonella bovis]
MFGNGVVEVGRLCWREEGEGEGLAMSVGGKRLGSVRGRLCEVFWGR